MRRAICNMQLAVPALGLSLLLAGTSACDTPRTLVAFHNAYPAGGTDAQVLYRAFWQAVAFVDPVSPGDTSDSQETVPASDNTAYALLAPGWDPTSDDGTALPASLIAVQSIAGYTVHSNDALQIAVDDAHFVGNCAASSFLSQAQADFITQRVFAGVLSGRTYDAATCTFSEIAP